VQRTLEFTDPQLGPVWARVSRHPERNEILLVISVLRSWDVQLRFDAEAALMLSEALRVGEPRSVSASDEDEQPAAVTAGVGWFAVRIPAGAAALSEALANAAKA